MSSGLQPRGMEELLREARGLHSDPSFATNWLGDFGRINSVSLWLNFPSQHLSKFPSNSKAHAPVMSALSH